MFERSKLRPEKNFHSRNAIKTVKWGLAFPKKSCYSQKVMKVLVIDDDQSLLTIWTTVLKKDGFEVITALDGKHSLVAEAKGAPARERMRCCEIKQHAHAMLSRGEIADRQRDRAGRVSQSIT